MTNAHDAPSDEENKAPAFLAVCAYALISYGMYRNNGFFAWSSLALVLSGTGLSILLALGVGRSWWTPLGRHLERLVFLVAAFNVVRSVRAPMDRTDAATDLSPWLSVGIAVGALGVVGWRYRGARVLTLVAFFVLGVAVIVGNPRPDIDVWHLQVEAGKDLLSAKNPYAARYLDADDPANASLPAYVTQKGGKPFPYPPLTLVAAALGSVVGDPRYVLLLATSLALALAVGFGRTLSLTACLPLLFLTDPRGPLVVREAWTDPLLLLGVVGVVSTRHRASVAVLPVIKQYGALMAPFLLRSLTPRQLSTMAAIAFLPCAPFLLADPAAFWHGVVSYHRELPARPEALTVSAALMKQGFSPLPHFSGFLAIAVFFVIWKRRPADATVYPVFGLTAGMLLFFLFSPQAFLNYYWLAGGLLLLGPTVTRHPSALAAREPEADQDQHQSEAEA